MADVLGSHRLHATAVLILLLGLWRIVTLYNINIPQARVLSNSSYSPINATGGRREMQPETIAAFAWVLSTLVTLLD